MIPGGHCTCTTVSPGTRPGSATWPVPDAERGRPRGPAAVPGRHLRRRRQRGEHARGLAGARPRPDLRKAWQAGIVLAGSSAGGICWFEGGTTDSFGPDLRAFTDGLGLLAGSYCPHYDSEPGRRPLYHRLIADGTLAAGIACDDGVAAHFTDDELTELIADRPARARTGSSPGSPRPGSRPGSSARPAGRPPHGRRRGQPEGGRRQAAGLRTLIGCLVCTPGCAGTPGWWMARWPCCWSIPEAAACWSRCRSCSAWWYRWCSGARTRWRRSPRSSPSARSRCCCFAGRQGPT